MKSIISFLTYMSALFSIVAFLRPRNLSVEALLWIPKLLAGALSPILGVFSALGVLWGVTKRDWKLTGTGILGIGLVAKLMNDIPGSHEQFENAFGPDWQEKIPTSVRPYLLPGRWSPLTRSPGVVGFQRDVVVWMNPKGGSDLLADLWMPVPGIARSGLAVIYAHGSGWRVGDKDMGTRHFFRRLAGQGHLVLDLAYTLWPQADIPSMVSELNRAVMWMKEKSGTYGLNPERIVLMGASAGGHLALLAAYAPDVPEFQPSPNNGDTSVRGVVAFYPPVDFLEFHLQAGGHIHTSPGWVDRVADAMMKRIFTPQSEHLEGKNSETMENFDMLAEMLGGDLDEIPETYRLLSPITHVSPRCPPTLLLQGSDDVFGLAPPLRRFHQNLQAARVPSILVEFPHTEHGFDLLLPQISPAAQAATYDVERFLALLV